MGVEFLEFGDIGLEVRAVGGAEFFGVGIDSEGVVGEAGKVVDDVLG